MSAPARVRTPWWFRLVRLLLNLALLTLLGLQVFALVILSTDKHLQLPVFAQRALDNYLHQQGLRVEFSKLEVSPSGTLYVIDPKIFLNGTEEPVVEAEYVIVEPDWFALLWSQQLSFSEVRFGHATCYCPPEASPSGEREPFLSEFGAGLASEGNHWWRLDYLRGQFLNLGFSAEGNFVLPAKVMEALATAPVPSPTQPGAPSLATQYRRWARAILELKPQFAAADTPFVEMYVTGENSGKNTLRISVQMTRARPPIPGLELSDAWIHFNATWDGSILCALTPALAHAQKIHYAPTTREGAKHEWVVSGPVWARLQLTDGPEGIFSGRPLRATLFTLATRVNDYPLDSLEADVNLRSWPSLPFSAAARQAENWLNISGRTDFAAQDGALAWRGGNITAHAGLRLETLLSAAQVQLPERLSMLKFDALLALAGNASFAPEGKLLSADLTVQTDGAHFERIDLDSLVAHARFSRDEAGGLVLNVDRADLTNRTWQVKGSYFQNLRTADFRLLVHGDIEPRVLDPYFAEWWPEIWNIITPAGQWPQGDVAYLGNWNQREVYDSLSVFAQIANARVRGVRTDEVHVRVEQRPEILSVYDITGHATGGGELHGAMFWTMKPPYDHIYEERMVFDTTLPLAAVGAVGGSEAEQIVQPLESTAAPTIHFEQRTGGLANPQPHVTSTHVHAEFSSPLHAYHVPLDRAVVEATAYKGFTDIPHFEFGLAGGQAEGNATVTTTSNGQDELRFSVLLQNARHTDFLAALGQFRAGEEATTPAPATPAPMNTTPAAKNGNSMLGDPSKPGLLDLALGGRIILGDPDSFAAIGQARVRNAQLGQLQLLGALSRTLSDIKVPLGEFSLNAAHSDLQIAHQYLRLPNLLVTGPSARIVSAGIYNIADGDLNFNALIFPVGQWDSFLLKQIASIMNPFSNTVTLKLHGKYEKPEWNVSMNPLRLFEDRTVEGPTIPGYPVTANGAPDLPELPPAPPLPELPVEKK